MSLRTSIEGAERAKRALEYRGLTQQALAEELWRGRSTISKFFNCKNVDRDIFLEVCHRLELDWQEIFEKPLMEDENYSFLADEQQPINSSALAVQSKLEKHTNEIENLDNSLTIESNNLKVRSQELLDGIQVTNNLEVGDLVQKAKSDGSVKQKTATNLKAKNIKLGNLTQEC